MIVSLGHIREMGEMRLGNMRKLEWIERGTMRAGDGGEPLARAYNDLSVIAGLPDIAPSLAAGSPGRVLALPLAEAGVSALPWQLLRTLERARITDAKGRLIADRWWRSKPSGVLAASLRLIQLTLSVLADARPPSGY